MTKIDELWCASDKLLCRSAGLLLSVVEVLERKLGSHRWYVRHGRGRFHVRPGR